MQNYWERILKSRLNRRRVLAASGATALAATIAAACGGDDSDSSGRSSSLLTVPQDTSDKAVPGGVFPTSDDVDLATADPHRAPGLIPLEKLLSAYDFLVKYGKGTEGRNGPITGDAAESWEFSPDGLTLTFKMRPNHRFDQRPPTSGRAMTAADVKYSWERFLGISVFGGDVRPTADSPIASLNAPDDKTVVIKLNFPYLSSLDLFAHERYLSIMPVEAEDKFDPRSETRGAGPFYMDKWEPSVRILWKKNPNWYEKGLPYLDAVEEYTIPTAAATLAQFEAGALWEGAGYRPEDILRVKRDHPEMVLSQLFPTLGGGRAFTTSRQPGSIMLDVRMRQALSMLIDRDLYLEALEGTEMFTSQGLPVDAKWNSHIPSPNPEWLDPKKNELGQGSKYFQYNVAEAKKLIAAAGYDGTPLNYHQGDQTHDPKVMDVLVEMWSQGIKVQPEVLAYNTTWREVCQRSAGLGYNGICYNTGSGLNAEQHISRWYAPGGEYKVRLGEADPALQALAQKIRTEINRQRQVELIKDFQREAAMSMPLIMAVGAVTSFQLHWPWLENFGVWTTGERLPQWRAYYWYNKSKHPKAS